MKSNCWSHQLTVGLSFCNFPTNFLSYLKANIYIYIHGPPATTNSKPIKVDAVPSDTTSSHIPACPKTPNLILHTTRTTTKPNKTTYLKKLSSKIEQKGSIKPKHAANLTWVSKCAFSWISFKLRMYFFKIVGE